MMSHIDPNEKDPFRIARGSFYNLIQFIAILGLPDVYLNGDITLRVDFTEKYFRK